MIYNVIMPVITQKNYQNIVRRQNKIEDEIDTLKRLIIAEIREESIRPSVLKKWDKISRDIDRGNGRAFQSAMEMKNWLKTL